MKHYTFTLELFTGNYTPNFDTIEYRAKNIIRDRAMEEARNGKLLFTENEMTDLLFEAYRIAGLQNTESMVNQKMWFAIKEKWIMEVHIDS